MNPHNLRLSPKAAEQLKSKPTPKITPEEKLAEKKRRDEMHARDRAKRKAALDTAKAADAALAKECQLFSDVEQQAEAQRKELGRTKARLDALEKEANQLDDRIKKLQAAWRTKREQIAEGQKEVNDLSISPLDDVRLRVQAAWNTCQDAWEKVGRRIVKKHRDRAAKKRAKEILF